MTATTKPSVAQQKSRHTASKKETGGNGEKQKEMKMLKKEAVF
jgi:hypothetical protein